MREYEVTVILKPDLDDETRSELIDRVENWLTHSEDEADKPTADHWGQQRLAYPIEKETEGYYILFNSLLDTTKISELERNIQYVDDILRHLVVRKDG